MALRIGIDASNLRAGGAVTHLVELLGHAEPLRHGISSVIVWGRAKTLAKLPERPWLTRVHVPALDRSLPYRIAWQRFVLPRRAREACDLLFAPGGATTEAFRPYVTMCRNMLPFDPPERARYKWTSIYWRLLALRFAQARAFRGANGVIFLNDYAREVAGGASRIRSERAVVVPHGISERFRLTPREQRPIGEYTRERPLRFLYTSIIDLYKHQWNVAEAVVMLRREGLPIAVDLVGPAYPPALAKVQAVLDAAGEHRDAVRILGEASHDALPAIYHAADAYVLASTCENMPNVLLEAMASGLPVACSRVRPMSDVLGDAGVYFDAEDPRSIADALRRLVLDPQLRATNAAAAYERARSYSWARCADDTFAFLARSASAEG